VIYSPRTQGVLGAVYHTQPAFSVINSYLTFYEAFRIEFYIIIYKAHRMQNNILTLCILEIVSSVVKSVKYSFLLFGTKT
jgi:hypothetical protein